MLIYDRIESNRRKTVIVLTLYVIATLLFVGYAAMWLTALIVQAATDSNSPAGHEVLTFKLLAAALAAVAALPLLAYLGYSSSPRLLLRLAGARRLGPNQERELRRIVENLSIGAGLPAPRLYVVESPAPNAFATGLDTGHAAMVVTRGLLRLLERSELEGVIAHEFSHIGNHDTRLNMIAAALGITLRLPVTLLHWIWTAAKRGVRSSAEPVRTAIGLLGYGLVYAPMILAAAILLPAAFWADFGFLGPAMFILPLHVFVLAPVLAPRVSGMLSRGREFLADADAVLLTRNPEGLARALAKIAAANRPAYVHPAVAPLYIADPSGPALWHSRTHPPIDARIARLAELTPIPPSVLASASEAGAKYGKCAEQMPAPPAPDLDPGPLAAFAEPGESTRVFRVREPAPLLESPSAGARIVARLPESALVIAFSREGEFLQAVTAERVFGYLPAAVSLEPVDMEPAEVQAHVPPPTPGESGDGSPSESQQFAVIALLALLVFVVSFFLFLDFGPR